jgi:hypothetical protein
MISRAAPVRETREFSAFRQLKVLNSTFRITLFQLTAAETAALRSQFVILKLGRGQHQKFLPYAFTEQGVT